jgi:hypothetical protein
MNIVIGIFFKEWTCDYEDNYTIMMFGLFSFESTQVFLQNI